MYRITNPNRFNNKLIPPFGHVLVQSRQPVPGPGLQRALCRREERDGADLRREQRVPACRFPGQLTPFPILTGTEQWKPGQEFVFYVLTKKYYPLPTQVYFRFRVRPRRRESVAIPGPSGIFLRLKYNPATFDRTLDAIVTFGQGAQGARASTSACPTRRSTSSSPRRPSGSISAATSSRPRREPFALNRHVRAVSAGTSDAPDGIEGQSDGLGCPMKVCTVWPSILAAALLLAWFEPAPCMAQAPPSATATARGRVPRPWTRCRRRSPPTSIPS